jgi:Holliday junction DNA helicase RuvA
MIASIRGKLLDCTPVTALIEAGGLGYEVFIPVTTAEKMPSTGDEVMLYIQDIYREDAALLYGFIDRESRDFFKLIVEKVSGIGPRIAVSLMSRFPLDYLLNAIGEGDSVALSKCPGIGKKTAERIIVELKDKIPAWKASTGMQNSVDSQSSTSTMPTGQSIAEKDAYDALITLGYKSAEAERSLKKALAKLGAEATTQDLIRWSLGN